MKFVDGISPIKLNKRKQINIFTEDLKNGELLFEDEGMLYKEVAHHPKKINLK